MMDMDRRRFLALMGVGAAAVPAASLLAGCSDDGGSANGGSSTVELQLSWLKDETFVGEYQAAEKGYWTSRNLDVGLVAGGGTIDPLVPVVAGKAFTSAPSAASVAGAIARGAELTIIASSTQKQPAALVSLASKPVSTVAALPGTTIGVNASTSVPFEAFLASNNIEASAVKIVPYNFDPSILTNGSVDALFGYAYDEPVDLAQQGIATETILFSDHNYNVINNAWAVESAVLTDPDRRARLVSLMAGQVQGWTDVLHDPTGLVPGLVAKYCAGVSVTPTAAIATVEAIGPLMTGGGPVADIFGLTPQLIDDTIAGLARQKSTLRTSNFDTSLMDEVRAQL
ncbi:ABC transporter substrate-binding protein [Nocardia sp. NPDC058658]|uniref:ABC transporter substrate-binding protein n=1 Tax=Nocardia sp. NPDC058658 TaxID=3346580 RepID=UPI00365FA001